MWDQSKETSVKSLLLYQGPQCYSVCWQHRQQSYLACPKTVASDNYNELLNLLLQRYLFQQSAASLCRRTNHTWFRCHTPHAAKNRHDEHALYCRLKTTVHFKHTSTAVTTVGISYSKSLVMTQNTIYFSSSKSSASVHKRTSGYRRIPFLSSLLLPPGEVSNRTQAVNSENTNHVRTRSKYHAIKKKCTCVVKFHVLACITLHNYDNNSSAVAVITDDRLWPSKISKGLEVKGCQSKPKTKTSPVALICILC